MARTKQTARKGKGGAPIVQQQVEVQRSSILGESEDKYMESDDESENENEEIYPEYNPSTSLVLNWPTTKQNNKLSLINAKKVRIFRKLGKQIVFRLIKTFNLFKATSLFWTESNLNFTGLESATDYLFYEIKSMLKTHENKSNMNYNSILFNGCSNISIWSLHYLYKAFNKSIFDLDNLNSIPVFEIYF